MRRLALFDIHTPRLALATLVGALALLLLPSLACAGPAAESASTSQPDLLGRLPADALTVGGIDFVTLRNSPAYEFFRSEGSSLENADEFHEFIERAGMDPREDLHRLAFAAGGVGPETPRDGAIIAVATFDRARLESSLGDHPSRTYSGHTLWAIDDGEEQATESELENRVEAAGGEGQGHVVILDDETIAVGSPGMLERIIDVKEGAPSARSNQRLMELVADVDADSEIWMVSAQNRLLSGLRPGGDDGPASQIPIDKIQSLILSVQLDDGVGLRLRGRTARREDAQLLGDSLNGMLAFGKMMLQSNSPEIFAILDSSIRAGSSGSDVTLRADLSMDDLRTLREFARDTLEDGQEEAEGAEPRPR